MNLNAEIINSTQPKFRFGQIDEKELSDKIKTVHRNTVRMILKIIAYQHQSDLLPEKWEIEHILPLQILKSKNWLNILEIKFPLKRGSILSQATDTLLRKKLQEIQSWYITRAYSK